MVVRRPLGCVIDDSLPAIVEVGIDDACGVANVERRAEVARGRYGTDGLLRTLDLGCLSGAHWIRNRVVAGDWTAIAVERGVRRVVNSRAIAYRRIEIDGHGE